MTDRPRVLVDLGAELERAAQRVLKDERRRFAPRRAPNAGTLMAGLAVASAVAVAVVAILFIGHRHPPSGTVGSQTGAASIPRGAILDRHGGVLVRSRRAIAVQIVPGDLPVPIRGRGLTQLLAPPAADELVYDRLAGALGISTRPRTCAVAGHSVELAEIACDVAHAGYPLPEASVTVASDVKPSVAQALGGGLPGVTEVTVYLTSYPHRDLAAQVLGTVGPITAAELKQPRFAGLSPDAIVGQTGLEAFYDRYLRGRDTVKTSLDLELEQAAQASLATSMARNAPAGAGAFVAMDPQDGQVYAMGSLPAYDPTIFTKPISQSAYNRLVSRTSGDPLNNRASDGLYATGSTFTPITALAALESGRWNLSNTYDDAGQYCLSQRRLCLHNAGAVANGVLDLTSAIRVSDDVFFFNLGAKLNVDPATHPAGGPLQQWARLFGIGSPTGVDLPYESSGILPDPRWRAQIIQLELQYEKQHRVGCCTIAYPGPWTVGDNVNLAVGQGDVLVTPLQLAVAYAAIANGGTIVRPHIASEVVGGAGDKVIQTVDPGPVRHLDIKPTYLDAIRQGLRQAASAAGGTSARVMANFPEAVYGAAGSADSARHRAQAWYAGYVPATATIKPIVVVVTVEKGGSGAVAAAPVARQILSQWFFGKPGPYIPGTSAAP
jgi:penicillin-binding protein 2